MVSIRGLWLFSVKGRDDVALGVAMLHLLDTFLCHHTADDITAAWP